MTPIEYIAFFNETGYGQAAFDVVSALLETKQYDIRVVPLNGSLSKQSFSKKSLSILDPLFRKLPNPRATQVYHCIPPMQMRIPRTYKSIGFATFETFEPPEKWVELLNRLDAIACPSQFNYKIFAHAGIYKPMFYLPHTFNSESWHKDVIPLDKHDKYTFLFVGTWKKRKGWQELIEAFCREFSSSDNVQLLIKTDKTQLATQEVAKIKTTLGLKKEFAPILFERRIFDDSYLPSFYKSANCLVMPTLGEGFGLPGLQCMAIKVPIIITNFSGCQDYASEDRCTLIEPSGFMLHSNMDNIVQFSNKKWPRITIQSVQDAMRRVYSNQDETMEKADRAYDYVHNNFTYRVAADAFGKIMENIYRVR